MGCFTVLKRMKKIYELFVGRKATDLPEQNPCKPALQSTPPSFNARAKPFRSVTGSASGRVRVLSAPSTLDLAGRDVVLRIQYEEQEDSNGQGVVGKDKKFSCPLPLPLPSPQVASTLKKNGSLGNGSVSILASGPLPLPPSINGNLLNFPIGEISAACHNFSVDRCSSEGISSKVYRASFGDDPRKLEATVCCLVPSSQGLKEFVSEVEKIASLHHPQLCKLLGFHAHEGSDQRMLVYERLCHGALDCLLDGRSDGPSIDWSTRMKIATCAAKGLSYLHEAGPSQAMYNEFSTANIQVDKDFSAKLSGYGFASYNKEIEISKTSVMNENLPMESFKRVLTPKSDVWSFGIVLLELLTGQKNTDVRNPKERNIVKWSRPFLADDFLLSLIIDPRIKGRVPPKAERIVADIALNCLRKEPSERPTMRAVAESLRTLQHMESPRRFPLQEPSAVARKQKLKSPSFSGIIFPAPHFICSPSPSSRSLQSVASPRSSASMLISAQTCMSTLSVERLSVIKKSSLSSSQCPGVEGF